MLEEDGTRVGYWTEGERSVQIASDGQCLYTLVIVRAGRPFEQWGTIIGKMNIRTKD